MVIILMENFCVVLMMNYEKEKKILTNKIVNSPNKKDRK